MRVPAQCTTKLLCETNRLLLIMCRPDGTGECRNNFPAKFQVLSIVPDQSIFSTFNFPRSFRAPEVLLRSTNYSSPIGKFSAF